MGLSANSRLRKTMLGKVKIMPCSDPTPTRREERAAKVLKIIVDFKSLGEDIEYPKGFNGDVSGYLIFGIDRYLDEATAILCSFCKMKGDDFIYNGRFKERRRLANWWDEHKEIDKREGRC